MKNSTKLLGTLAVLAVLAGCGKADSQTATDTLTWTHPVTREDGSALPLAEIRETLVAWGPSGGPYTQGSVTVAAPATTVQVTNPGTPGTRCYVAYTRDTGMRLSVASAQACKTILANPRPPTGLTVQ